MLYIRLTECFYHFRKKLNPKRARNLRRGQSTGICRYSGIIWNIVLQSTSSSLFFKNIYRDHFALTYCAALNCKDSLVASPAPVWAVFSVSSLQCEQSLLWAVFTVSSLYCEQSLLWAVFTVSSLYCVSRRIVLYESSSILFLLLQLKWEITSGKVRLKTGKKALQGIVGVTHILITCSI